MFVGLGLFPSAASAANWGSFDASRIQYPTGTLDGSAHTKLAGIITSKGNTLVGGTSELTAGYLSVVDVFYTSIVNSSLSAAEQVALQDWIKSGGVLIATADYAGYTYYNSYTSAYSVVHNGFNAGPPAVTVVTHPITLGVTSIYFAAPSSFTYSPSNALLLAKTQYNDPFMLVLEPATNFTVGGCVLVFGDHNLFNDPYIVNNDNTLLANNIVAWAGACGKLANGTPCTPSSNCESGNCVDGYCCDTSCSGSCMGCNVPGSPPGVCGPMPKGADPDNDCAAGACNGAGACAFDNGQSCGTAGDCLSDNCIDAFCCDSVCDANCKACNVPGSEGTCSVVSTPAAGECSTCASGDSESISLPNVDVTFDLLSVDCPSLLKGSAGLSVKAEGTGSVSQTSCAEGCKKSSDLPFNAEATLTVCKGKGIALSGAYAQKAESVMDTKCDPNTCYQVCDPTKTCSTNTDSFTLAGGVAAKYDVSWSKAWAGGAWGVGFSCYGDGTAQGGLTFTSTSVENNGFSGTCDDCDIATAGPTAKFAAKGGCKVELTGLKSNKSYGCTDCVDVSLDVTLTGTKQSGACGDEWCATSSVVASATISPGLLSGCLSLFGRQVGINIGGKASGECTGTSCAGVPTAPPSTCTASADPEISVTPGKCN